MEKQIKLIESPFNSSIEVVNDLVIALHFPCSENDVTIQINPAITEYKENGDTQNAQIRQIMVSESTDDTKTLHFDLAGDNIKTVISNGREYKIKLLSIGKENIEGKDFPSFEFYIEE
jgi:hypothetical protein